MLVCLPAINIQENQGRVCAHRFTPCSREELKELLALVPRLRELGVSGIVCSDLDGQSGAALARRLNVGVEEWQCLRRRNWGKLHGTPRDRARRVLSEIVEYTVPVKGGDSYASFNKRCSAAAERLQKQSATTLLLVDAEVLERLTGASGAQRYHLYQVDIGKPDEITTVHATA